MADDNVTADPGTGGEVFATDEIGGAHYPWVKLAFGDDDTATKVKTGVGLPVTLQASSGTDIGDVDIASFPAGNLGAQLASASLSVTLATDEGSTPITGAVTATLSTADATTLGDIKTNTADIPNVIGLPDSAAPSKVLSIAGNDGTKLQAVKVSSDGRLSVDVNSGAGGIEYTEDVTVGGTAIVGTATMMERDDDLGTLTPVEGDWASLRCTAEGALWVQDFNSDSIKGVLDNLDDAINANKLDVKIAEGGFDGKLTSPDAGTYIGKVDLGDTDNEVLDGIEAAVEKIDKAVHVDDADFTLGSDSGVMMMGFAGTQSVDTDDAAALACDTDGALHVNVKNPFGGAVTGTVAVSNGASGAAVNIQDGDNSITVDWNGTAPPIGSGLKDDALLVTLATDSPGTVDLGSNNDVTVTGNVGHGDSDTGDAVKIGAKAVAHLSNPSAVTAGQRSDTYCNRHGIPWQIGGHPNVITSTARTDAAQTGERCIAAVGPGLIPVVTRVTALCDNANSVDVGMKVAFSADATLPTDADTGTADILVDHPGIPAGGGFTIGDGSGVIGTGQDGDEIRYTCEVPTGGAVTLSVSYYTIEV